jgi:hypothetical protein
LSELWKLIQEGHRDTVLEIAVLLVGCLTIRDSKGHGVEIDGVLQVPEHMGILEPDVSRGERGTCRRILARPDLSHVPDAFQITDGVRGTVIGDGQISQVRPEAQEGIGERETDARRLENPETDQTSLQRQADDSGIREVRDQTIGGQQMILEPRVRALADRRIGRRERRTDEGKEHPEEEDMTHQGLEEHPDALVVDRRGISARCAQIREYDVSIVVVSDTTEENVSG